MFFVRSETILTWKLNHKSTVKKSKWMKDQSREKIH